MNIGFSRVRQSIKGSVVIPLESIEIPVKVKIGLNRIRKLCQQTKYIAIPIQPFLEKNQIDTRHLYCMIQSYENTQYHIIGAYDNYTHIVRHKPIRLTICYSIHKHTSYASVEEISSLPGFVSGTTCVKIAKALLFYFGVHEVKLHDLSTQACPVDYGVFEHSYSHRLVFTKGQTYYEQFGFSHDNPNWKTIVKRLYKLTTERVRRDLLTLLKVGDSSHIIHFYNLLEEIDKQSNDKLFYKTIQSFNCIAFSKYHRILEDISDILTSKNNNPSISSSSSIFLLLDVLRESSSGYRFLKYHTRKRSIPNAISKTDSKRIESESEKLTLSIFSKPIHIWYESTLYTFRLDNESNKQQEIIGTTRTSNDDNEVEVIRFTLSNSDIILEEAIYSTQLYLIHELQKKNPRLPSKIRLNIGSMNALVYMLFIPNNRNLEYELSDIPEFKTRKITLVNIRHTFNRLRNVNWYQYVSTIRSWFSHPKCTYVGKIGYLYGEIKEYRFRKKESVSTSDIIQKIDKLQIILQNNSYKYTLSNLNESLFHSFMTLFFDIPDVFYIQNKLYYDKHVCKYISLLYNNVGYSIQFPFNLIQ